MLRGAVDVWIGNAAAVLHGCWGTVTRRAHETGDRRTALSTHAQCVRAPILLAVEPHSMAWVAGPRGPDRSGESGCALVAKWPCVERVRAAAGQGLARGVKRTKEARAAEVHPPTVAKPIALGRDVLHPPRERQRVMQGQWRRAERL